jgi:hypothetical protein
MARHATDAALNSEDSHWVVVDGRRWRATDPAIESRFRAELVDELMSARRAVGAARRETDRAAEQTARARVQCAKVALGERGEPWWEPTERGRRDRLAAVTLALSRHRAPTGTICPSDVARTLGGTGWRRLLEPVREVVRELARAGRVEVRQRGSVLDPDQPWTGPVRVAARASDGDGGSSATAR